MTDYRHDRTAIELKAKQELAAERFREEVDALKKQLKARKSFWDRLFPYRIIVVRKTFEE